MASATERGNVAEGLEGVVVAATRLSDVDGEAGRLIIAGRDVERLAEQGDFETAAHALWSAGGVSAPEPQTLQSELGAARVRVFEGLSRVRGALDVDVGMDALRGAVAQLPDTSTEVTLTAAMAVFGAAWWRIRAKKAPLPPDPSLSHAADYLRMVTGEAPTAVQARGMGAYLCTVSDHGMNASTFAARVVASTGSDLVSSVVAAIGALKGPLHGGAPGPVLDMLDAIGAPDRATEWIEKELASGRRIMGMGHRVYRVRDPRAAVLEASVMGLRAAGASTPRLELARAVEAAAFGVLAKKYPARTLAANVEFYTAVLLDALGIDRQLFTPTFAVGRVAGWCAHVAEQRKGGRLIRPQSIYVGDLPSV